MSYSPLPPATAASRRHPLTWRRHAGAAIAIVLAAVVYTLATGLMDGGVGVSPMRLLHQPLYPLANAWPGLLFAGLMLALTRRLLLSFGLAFLLQTVVYAVNGLKIDNLGTPLIPADFRMVGQLSKGGAHVLGGYLPSSPLPYLALLGGAAIVIALWRYEPRILPRRTHGKRTVAGIVLAGLLVTLLAGMPGWRTLYNGKTLWLEPWSAVATVNHSGLISALMMYHLQYGHGARKPDPKAALQLLSQTEPALRQRLGLAPAASGTLPDVVVVQSESYFDPAIMHGYEAGQISPNVHRLARTGDSGALYIPTFGGGTIRTEFEVLTGLPLRYFPDLQFPYLQINAKQVPSVVRVLGRHGYETIAIHGNDPSFWNRSAALKALGFDRFVSQKAFPADARKDGKYMADSAMTDEIMAQLKNAGPPRFLFAISLEGHGPYNTEPADVAARDAVPVPSAVTGSDRLEMQNYLYHIGHADEELGRLTKLLAKRERPTLVLFYGDHLPALVGVFNALGFVDGQDMLNQPGHWLLIDPRHPGKPEQQTMAAWMLPGKLLDAAGIHDSAYFALTQVVAPQLADLTRAPGAVLPTLSADQKQTDKDMSSVAKLQLTGKLAALLAKHGFAGGESSQYAGDSAGDSAADAVPSATRSP